MNHKKTAKKILSNIGGEENIDKMTHCATRLRINLHEDNLVNVDEVKETDGVVTALFNSGVFQVIIGNEVPHVYKEVNDMLSNETNKDISKDMNTDSENRMEKKERTSFLNKIMDFISSVFTPILPAIIGAGLIKSFLALAVVLGLNDQSNIYYFINFIGDAPLYFLPMMLAYTSADKLGVNKFLSVAIAGAMLHPNYNALITDAFSINTISVSGVPVVLAQYSASVIPVLLTVLFQVLVEKASDKWIHKSIIFFAKPVITILLTAFVGFVILGPIGFVAGAGVNAGLSALENYASWLVPTLMGAFSPLLIMTGMHYGSVPFMTQSIASQGYETLSGPGQLPSNIAQGAASLAVGLKTKQRKLKQTALSVGGTALLGITEPAMYGVTLQFKKLLPSVMIGGAAGGLYAGITGVKTYSFTSPGLIGLVAYIGPDGWGNFVNAIISAIIGFTVTFLIVWFWGAKNIDEK